MLDHLIGDVMIFVVLGVLGLAIWLVNWGLRGGLWNWEQARRERHQQEEMEAADTERALDWDRARAAEFDAWVAEGWLPTPVTRVYPAYQEFTWEWGRLQHLGYRMDHGPVQLDDGQLMVTYSLVMAEEQEPVEMGRLPSPPR